MWITILQIITTQKNLLYISLFTLQTQWSAQTGDLHDFRNVTTAFLNIENNQVCNFKCLCDLTWVLRCIYVQPCSNACASCCGIFHTNNSIFELYGSRKCKTARGSQLFDHSCFCVWTNYHKRYVMCAHQKSLWSWSSSLTTDTELKLILYWHYQSYHLENSTSLLPIGPAKIYRLFMSNDSMQSGPKWWNYSWWIIKLINSTHLWFVNIQGSSLNQQPNTPKNSCFQRLCILKEH